MRCDRLFAHLRSVARRDEWSGHVTEGILGGFCPKGHYMISDQCEILGNTNVNFDAVPYRLPMGKVPSLFHSATPNVRHV